MNYLDNLLKHEAYSLEKSLKASLLLEKLNFLTKLHFKNCHNYKKILNGMGLPHENIQEISDFPFLPVRVFKNFEMLSVDPEFVVKTMSSSGTSGQTPSKIFLDKTTAFNQTKVLTNIVKTYIGSKRIPMIIIDTPDVLKNRDSFSARGAGILGFSMFASKKIFALNNDMTINLDLVNNFIEDNKGSPFFLFGFTFIIFKYFINELIKNHISLSIPNGTVIHGGGWKKILDQAITNDEFKKRIFQSTMIENVYDYYGMVEQTGSISLECDKGYLHTSIYQDVLIRDPMTFSSLDFGKRGLIQTLSVLPYSYPGHSLLTEDEGTLIGEDDCSCGRLGKYFKIHGRMKNSEIRGCSDTQN